MILICHENHSHEDRRRRVRARTRGYPLLAGVAAQDDDATASPSRPRRTPSPGRSSRSPGTTPTVVDVVRPGVEPHDAELTVQQTADLTDADRVVYERGLSPAVDEVAADLDPDPGARGRPTRPDRIGDDPHFWLDPTRLQDVAARGRAPSWRTADPDHAADYRRARHRSRTSSRPSTRTSSSSPGSRTARAAPSSSATTRSTTSATATTSTSRRSTASAPTPSRRPATSWSCATSLREEGITTVFAETPRLARARRDASPTSSGIEVAVLDPIEGSERRDCRRGLPLADARQPRLPCGRRTTAHDRPAHERPARPDGARRRARRPARPARHRPRRRRRRGRRRPRRQRLGQVHAGPRRCSDWCRSVAERPRCSATPLERFRDWQRVGFVPAAATRRPPASPPRSARWSPRAGWPAAALWCRCAGPTRRRSRAALEAVGLADRARRPRSPCSPAASSSGSSSPGRSPASPSCWCSTSRPPASTSPPSRPSRTLLAGWSAGGTTSCWSPTSSARWSRWSRRTVVMRQGRQGVRRRAAARPSTTARTSTPPPGATTGPSDHRPDLGTPLDRAAGR